MAGPSQSNLRASAPSVAAHRDEHRSGPNANDAALATANPAGGPTGTASGACRAAAPLRSGSGLRGKPRGQQIFSAARRPRARDRYLPRLKSAIIDTVQDRAGDRRRSGRVGDSFADVRLGRESSPGDFRGRDGGRRRPSRRLTMPLMAHGAGRRLRLGPATFAGGSFLRPEVHLRRILRPRGWPRSTRRRRRNRACRQ